MSFVLQMPQLDLIAPTLNHAVARFNKASEMTMNALNRRSDFDLRAVVDEGKRLSRSEGQTKAAAYLYRYSVPATIIIRVIAEAARSNKKGEKS